MWKREPGRGHDDKDRPAIIAWVSRQGAVVIQATRDFTVQTVQKAADLTVHTGSRLYTDSASSSRALKGYVHDYVNHTKKEYARGRSMSIGPSVCFPYSSRTCGCFEGSVNSTCQGMLGAFSSYAIFGIRMPANRPN